jgi:uncharacterized protein (TIGR02646 family)
MIRYDRPPQPAVLQRLGDTWTQALLKARRAYERSKGAARTKTGKAVLLAEEKYRHREVKAALVALFHGKCAFCESKITHVDYGHIEHYRPKSRFPEETFAWDNLLLACGVCNGAEHKGDRFPGPEEGGPLLNPCGDDPDKHLRFKFDPAARLASVYGKTKRGRTTEQVLGLNRLALREHRSKEVAKLAVLAQLAGADATARELFAEAQKDDAPYAAFARALAPKP